MSFGIDRDRSWMEPLTPEGNINTDDPDLQGIVGCHQGPSAGLNILGAQPGCEYTWERLPRPGDDSIIRVRMEGGEIVRAGDPESAAMSLFRERGDYDRTSGSSLDSTHNNGEVMLVRWPTQAVRAKHERERARALAMVRGGAEDFASGASAAEQAAAGARPSRFRRSDHSLQSEDTQGNTVEVWKPDQGIIREG